ncbi:hypothetical protein AQPE_0233 [Aquipluma nitroreducens]|uniref:Uncharacterized protein n=1 Tax=Aquipluma nitroreducens TaxID=2010828 RepID=A0A5K7S3J8_9BACT|nr:hypothetical protein [Aquipluma nitroreducens]BBE16096.1 hypothetical protein AQPE_0233 [Aquipluma nitroreducens]
MDYLVLGSNGFAQMGDSAFYKKLKIEMRVLLDYFHSSFPIPQKFKTIAYYSVKTFQHDFGDYQEIVLWYDSDYIDSLEESEIESDNEFFDLFWTWFRVIESVDLESDQLTNQIKETYFKSVDASKGEHLSVSIAS